MSEKPTPSTEPLHGIGSANAAKILDLEQVVEHLKQEVRDSALTYEYLHTRFNEITTTYNKLVKEFNKLAEQYYARFPETFSCPKCSARVPEAATKCRQCGYLL